ncbi:hypothetical protein [Anaerobaca lacustris]|uniref:Uncharacterized protein n=1 Tax=Anaerobaca lacustris TaxID=3044600 RepID=A0AAW6U728_9BACT|nr:hypothetical protein [Sedimentisphaerales bacterium M17dextr]
MSKEDMELTSRGDMKAAKGGLPWYTWDVVLLGALFLFGTFGNSFPLLSYLGGLRNDKNIVFMARVWFFLLTPIACVCLAALIVRIVCLWPLRIVRLRRLIVLQIVASLGTLAYVGLPFLRLGPPEHKMHLWGMRRYVQTQVDVPAIRAWLTSLDPNDWHDVQIDFRRNGEGQLVPRSSDLVLPACILNLKPRSVSLSFVEGCGFGATLRWGDRLLGTWGMAIGPETTGAPPDLSGGPEWDGVRIWHDREFE